MLNKKHQLKIRLPDDALRDGLIMGFKSSFLSFTVMSLQVADDVKLRHPRFAMEW